MKKGKEKVKTKFKVKTAKKASKIDLLLHKNNLGIKLDIGCGDGKQPGFVGMDVRELPGVDIVHNLERFPYPLPNESCSLITASHVLEHMNPASTDPRLVGLFRLLMDKKVISKAEVDNFVGEYETFGVFLTFMNEVWRIMKPEGRFAFIVPYAGSIGYYQDPTHINPINESTIAYFDPLDKSGMWNIYKPNPWKIIACSWNMDGHLETILEKRRIDKSYTPNDNKKV